METMYRLLWQTKQRELWRAAERERMAHALRGHSSPSFAARVWSAIGATTVVVLILLLQVGTA